MDNLRPIIRFLAGRLGAYLLAVAIAYVLATVTATQSVVASLDGMGVAVGLADRLAMTERDIRGMAPMFLPMVAFALLVAFLSSALLSRWLHRWRLPLYFTAGAAALVCIHLALHLAFGITPVAIARSGGGLVMQGMAGGIGGLIYIAMVEWLVRRAAGAALAGPSQSAV
jgi:hypothetical protein